MAGWKFWEWETEDEKREREAQDFTRQANQMTRDANAESFLRDAQNINSSLTGGLNSAASSIGTALGEIAQPGRLEEPINNLFGAAKSALPQPVQKGMDFVGEVAEESRNAYSTYNTLMGRSLQGEQLTPDEEMEMSSAVVRNADFGGIKALGKAVPGMIGLTKGTLENVTTAAGKYATELKGVTSGMDFLSLTPINKVPFPDEAIPGMVKEIKTLADNTGGATYNIATRMDKLRAPEFAIGIFPNRSKVIEGSATEKDIATFIEDNKNILVDPRMNVGLWENEGKTYLDLSVTTEDFDQARELGKHFKQIAIYDLKRQQEIMIGGTAAGDNLVKLVQDGDKYYVGDPKIAKDGIDMSIGPDGLINALERNGRNNAELAEAGYKGVYFPDHDEVHLFDKPAKPAESVNTLENVKSKVIGLGVKIFGEGPKSIIPIEEAGKLRTAGTQTMESIRNSYGDDVAGSIEANPHANWTDNGLELNLTRYQNEGAAGNIATRGGVFYGTPESAADYKLTNTSGIPGHVGGNQKISGKTVLKNPLIVEAYSNDSLIDAALANEKILPRGIRDNLIIAAEDMATSRGEQQASASLRLSEQFGFSNEEIAALENLSEPNRRYAVKEMYLAKWARENGIDGVIGMTESGKRVGAETPDLKRMQDLVDNLRFYKDSMEGAMSATAKAEFRRMYQGLLQRVEDTYGHNMAGWGDEEFDKFLNDSLGRRKLDIFEVFDVRENKYPSPKGDFSVFDVFKPVGDALQQVPSSVARSGAQGALSGGLANFDEEEFKQDPIGSSLKTIEGAALGAAERAVVRQHLNTLVKAGASNDIIKAFDYKLLQHSGSNVKTGQGGLLKVMYNAMLSGPATMEAQAIGLAPEVASKFIRDFGADLGHKHPENIAADAMGMLEGVMQGSRAFGDGMLHLLDEGVFETPTRMIDAIDTWSKAVIYGMEVGYSAGKKADKLGLTDSAKWQYVKNGLADPVAHDLHDDAIAAAMRATYMGETGGFGKALSSAQKSHPWIQFILPFVGAVHRMTTRALEFSPVGAIGTMADVASGVYDISKAVKGSDNVLRTKSIIPGGMAWDELGNYLPKESTVTPLAERAGNNVIGTAFYFYFYQQAMEDKITGYGPDSQSQRDALVRQGWQPFSIKIGDQYVDYRRLGPVAQVLAMAAFPAEMQKYNKEGGDFAAKLHQGITSFVALGEEMTYLRGLTEFARMLNYGDPENWLESSARRFVPFGALLSTIATGIDPVSRDASNPVLGEGPAGIVGEFQSMIPGLRQQLPEKVDSYGRIKENPKAGLASIIPTRFSRWTPDKVDSELQRLDLPVGRVLNEITDENGNTIRLSDAQKRTFQDVAGTGKRAAFDALLNSKEYEKADDEERKKMLGTVTRHASLWGREALSPGSVKDAELARYNGDSEKAGVDLAKAIRTKSQLDALVDKKYTGLNAKEATQVDGWKSSLAALRQGYGNAIGDQVFTKTYGYAAFVKARHVKVSDSYTNARKALIKANPEYIKFYGAAIDPNEVNSARTIVPA